MTECQEGNLAGTPLEGQPSHHRGPGWPKTKKEEECLETAREKERQQCDSGRAWMERRKVEILCVQEMEETHGQWMIGKR